MEKVEKQIKIRRYPIFIYIGFMSKEVDFNENDIPTKKEI